MDSARTIKKLSLYQKNLVWRQLITSGLNQAHPLSGTIRKEENLLIHIAKIANSPNLWFSGSLKSQVLPFSSSLAKLKTTFWNKELPLIFLFSSIKEILLLLKLPNLWNNGAPQKTKWFAYAPRKKAKIMRNYKLWRKLKLMAQLSLSSKTISQSATTSHIPLSQVNI